MTDFQQFLILCAAGSCVMISAGMVVGWFAGHRSGTIKERDAWQVALNKRAEQISSPFIVVKPASRDEILHAISHGIPWEYEITTGPGKGQVHKGRFDIDPLKLMKKGWAVRLRSTRAFQTGGTLTDHTPDSASALPKEYWKQP